MYLDLDDDYPELWRLSEIVRLIQNDGLGVIPTDSYYAFVCDIRSRKAIERLYRIKNLDPKKHLSILCRDLSMVSHYTRSLSTTSYRAMKRTLPGPYTFILKASSEVPRTMLQKKRKTLGVRIPDDAVCAALLEELGVPLLCSSVRTPADEFWVHPAQIAEKMGKRLDFIVDAGERLAEPSTIVDLTGPEPEIIREGKGDVELFV